MWPNCRAEIGLAIKAGLGHLSSWHAAGPRVLAPVHLAGTPQEFVPRNVKGGVFCDLWVQRCQSESLSSSLSSWLAAPEPGRSQGIGETESIGGRNPDP